MERGDQFFYRFAIIEAFQDRQTKGLTQLVMTWQLRYGKRHEGPPSDNSCDFFLSVCQIEDPSVCLFEQYCPYGMQRLLSAAVWDDALVREDLRNYVYEHLGTIAAILVIDETSFAKCGEKSAGVQVQYCGTTGQIENCQVAVFLDYVTAHGHTLIDCGLYLPKEWIDDPDRCREAGIPETVRFQTKCELAREMIERIWKAQIPISWADFSPQFLIEQREEKVD